MRTAISLFGSGLIVAAAVASGCNLAQAQDCPGNPDALGTSRVLAIDPKRVSKDRSNGPCGGPTAFR